MIKFNNFLFIRLGGSNVIQHSEVEPIQDYIGSLPGFDDIPGLFDSIARTGLYDSNALRLCQGSHPVPKSPGSFKSEYPIGAGLNALSGIVQSESPFDGTQLDWMMKSTGNPTVSVKGGISWQILNSRAIITQEIATILKTVTNTGTNFRTVPAYLYELTMKPKTVTVVMQWSTDTVTFGLEENSWAGHRATGSYVPEQAYKDLIKKLVTANNELLDDPKDEKWSAGAKLVSSALDDFIKYLAPEKDSKAPQADPNAPQTDPNAPQADPWKTPPVSRDSPLVTWVSQIAGVWKATYSDLLEFASEKSKIEDDKNKEQKSEFGSKSDILLKAAALMKSQIRTIASGPSRGDSFVSTPFKLTMTASNLLNDADPEKGAKAFIEKFGHRFLTSYSEAGKLAAVWCLTLDEDSTEEVVEKFELFVQQYFKDARSVPEACDFFTDLESRKDWKVNVKTTILGFRPPASTVSMGPKRILAKDAKSFLTIDALQRNRIRTLYKLRPFAGLDVDLDDKRDEQKKKSFQAIRDVSPDPKFVLGLEQILQKLFVLQAYSQASSDCVQDGPLTGFWKRFLELEGAKNMNDNGVIEDKAAKELNTLDCELIHTISEAESVLSKSISEEKDSKASPQNRAEEK
jgi:hypothetical protein